jgi:Phosphotransferase enzyme family
VNSVLRFWSVSRPAQTQEIPSLAFAKAVHPCGVTQRIRVITGGVEPAGHGRPSDVVILAPAGQFHPATRSLEQGVADATAAIAPNGLIYVVAPRHLRRRILRLLRERGFEIGSPRLHLRSGAARYYIPLTARSLRFAVDSWTLPRRWRFLMQLLGYVPGSAKLLSLLLPTIGFTASRPGSTPFSWLSSRLPGTPTEELVATSWRHTEASALVFGFSGKDSVPQVVAKQAPPSQRLMAFHEADMLKQVAPFARQAGVGVPRLIEFVDEWGQTYVLETGVSGRPLSQLLATRPGDLSGVVHKLSTWLEAWHQNSVQRSPLTSAECEEMILGPARALAEGLHFGPEYLAWLESVCSRLVGSEVPWVNTHNDLTMANVLRDQDGRFHVVDWEAARPRGLPLADFWYSVCDAATAFGPQDRATMFNHCFLKGGTFSALVAPHDQRLREIVGGPPEWLELSFHACWLQHAVNEQTQMLADEDSPFLAIVNALASSALDYEMSEGPAARKVARANGRRSNAKQRGR